jgi:hypothetical protein
MVATELLAAVGNRPPCIPSRYRELDQPFDADRQDE